VETGLERVTDNPSGASSFATEVASIRRGGSVEASALTLVAQLTVAERLWLLDGDQRFWTGVLDWARHGYNHVPVVAGAIPRLGLPGLRFTDGPRGIVVGRSTCFPVSIARGATWDPELEERIGVALGLEARAQGANLFGGICVNLLRHPAWGRAQETYGEDPVHLGAMGEALARGAQRHVMACVKHFALNSMENARFRVDVQVDDRVLHEVYLPHFRKVVDAGVAAVMSAYNAVNGQWCGDSPRLLTAILRDEWRFTGIVISDFVWGLRDPVGSTAAGLDVEMPFRQQRARTLGAALTDGLLSAGAVERAAVRIVSTQLRSAETVESEEPDRTVVACDAHRALAREASVGSMVLLRNERVSGTPLLPLDPRSIRRAAVIGRLATCANLGDRGSSNVRPPTTTSPLQGLRRVLATRYDDGTDLRRAASIARTSDVAIVVVGYRDVDEGEFLFATDPAAVRLLPWPLSTRPVARSLHWLTQRFVGRRGAWGGDRADLRLRASDEALIAAVAAANPRTVVVVIGGSGILMENWRTQVPAIVMAWYGGMEGGHALADVLTGASEPGGRLPFAIPTSELDLPSFDRNAVTARYDRWYGYRKLERDGNPPAFAFGFGLGYTTWRLSKLRVGEDTAELTVTNTGIRPGATVVQLYAVAAPADERPGRQLVGFARVRLPAASSAAVSVRWTTQPLSVRDPQTRQWSVVPGRYHLEAARYLGDPEAVVAEGPSLIVV
jgi:beta-glucosidase